MAKARFLSFCSAASLYAHWRSLGEKPGAEIMTLSVARAARGIVSPQETEDRREKNAPLGTLPRQAQKRRKQSFASSWSLGTSCMTSSTRASCPTSRKHRAALLFPVKGRDQSQGSRATGEIRVAAHRIDLAVVVKGSERKTLDVARRNQSAASLKRFPEEALSPRRRRIVTPVKASAGERRKVGKPGLRESGSGQPLFFW